QQHDEGGRGDSQRGGDPGAMNGQPDRAEQQCAPAEALAYQYRRSAGADMRRPEPHSAPLVEGIASGARGSISLAMRNARATDLKHASATWCALWPRRRVMCSVTSAFIAKARKNSSNSSVSISPIFGRSKLTSQTRNGRPEMSTAASASVSSIGTSAWP